MYFTSYQQIFRAENLDEEDWLKFNLVGAVSICAEHWSSSAGKEREKLLRMYLKRSDDFLIYLINDEDIRREYLKKIMSYYPDATLPWGRDFFLVLNPNEISVKKGQSTPVYVFQIDSDLDTAVSDIDAVLRNFLLKKRIRNFIGSIPARSFDLFSYYIDKRME